MRASGPCGARTAARGFIRPRSLVHESGEMRLTSVVAAPETRLGRIRIITPQTLDGFFVRPAAHGWPQGRFESVPVRALVALEVFALRFVVFLLGAAHTQPPALACCVKALGSAVAHQAPGSVLLFVVFAER